MGYWKELDESIENGVIMCEYTNVEFEDIRRVFDPSELIDRRENQKIFDLLEVEIMNKFGTSTSNMIMASYKEFLMEEGKL